MKYKINIKKKKKKKKESDKIKKQKKPPNFGNRRIVNNSI